MLETGYFRRMVASWGYLPAPNNQASWPELLTLWSAPEPVPTLAQLTELFASRVLAPAQAAPADEAVLMQGLRRMRHLLMLSLMTHQAAGRLELSHGLMLISAFARMAVQAALEHASARWRERFGQPLDRSGHEQGLVVVGMGKLGGMELNPSSDIDLIFLFREPGETNGLRADGSQTPTTVSAEEFFARATRDCCQILHEVSADGFVFRVDTRLRPHGDSGPPALSLAALELYLVEDARDWERFAWLKGEVIAQSHPSGATDRENLEQLLKPFVYRRYLDFGAFAALRDLHRQIRQQAGGKEHKRERADNGGWDVKLGRGGIREIEFCIQLIQILRGSRYSGLRVRSSLEALAQIRQLAHSQQETILPVAACDQLKAAYCYFRALENALQWREDQQTQWLPQAGEALGQVCQLMGLPRDAGEQLWQEAREHSSQVEKIFDGLLAPADAGQEAASTDLPQPPEDGNTDQHIPALDALRSSRRYLAAKPATVSTVERLLEQSIRLPEMQDSAAFSRLTGFFETVMGRPSYLSLLDQFPLALQRLARLLGKAQWAANYIKQHPIVLDELLDGGFLERLDLPVWRDQLTREVLALDEPMEDLEQQLDLVREAHHAQILRLLAQDLEGILTVELLADELSGLADAVLQSSLECLWPKVLRQFKRPPDTPMRMGIVAYGKLGGKELGYASDLDLVFLIADQEQGNEELYTRLVQRLGQWLTTQTGAGMLFDCDYRLRPNGDAGMLVNSLSSFQQYQESKAWVWEHQALTRARFCAGDPTLRDTFEHIRKEILMMPRQWPALRDEVAAMRKKMHDGHPNRSVLFDLKHDHGGMVDIEFIVQTLVLGHAHSHPALVGNLGNIALLGLAADAGLIDRSLATQCQQAYRRYRHLQHMARLNDASYAREEEASVSHEIQAVKALWEQVFRP
jgi:[glutamine synthetase] adenylyltransferase / [glutamine synthetase]-adenylyl-L-tyrosine phosphorylase